MIFDITWIVTMSMLFRSVVSVLHVHNSDQYYLFCIYMSEPQCLYSQLISRLFIVCGGDIFISVCLKNFRYELRFIEGCVDYLATKYIVMLLIRFTSTWNLDCMSVMVLFYVVYVLPYFFCVEQESYLFQA